MRKQGHVTSTDLGLPDAGNRAEAKTAIIAELGYEPAPFVGPIVFESDGISGLPTFLHHPTPTELRAEQALRKRYKELHQKMVQHHPTVSG